MRRGFGHQRVCSGRGAAWGSGVWVGLGGLGGVRGAWKIAGSRTASFKSHLGPHRRIVEHLTIAGLEEHEFSNKAQAVAPHVACDAVGNARRNCASRVMLLAVRRCRCCPGCLGAAGCSARAP